MSVLRFEMHPDVAVLMEEAHEAGKAATTKAMAAAGNGLKLDWRQEVERANLGPRVAKSIQSKVFPERRTSLNAATLVWSKAPKIVSAFEQGVTIQGKSGNWLAIPTEEAGKGPGGRRITPGEWEQRRGLPLRMVFLTGQTSLLVAEARINKKGLAVASKSTRTKAVLVPIFILVPQVTLEKRLDLGPIAERWGAALPDMIVANWKD